MLNVYNTKMLNNLILSQCAGFQWDDGNLYKNLLNHEVVAMECEEVFFKEPLLLMDDIKHSQKEQRYYVLGQTDVGRKLFIAFTIRKKLIRVISARDMNKKERKFYGK